MEDILNIFGGAQMRNIVILIGVDVILGIIAALKSKEFVLGKLAGFMKRGILIYAFGFAVIIMIGEALPSLSIVVTVAYWLVVLALIGSILANLGKLGLPIPKMLKK
ncbi:MAG: phage holin family protein [Candidatus Nealsonbacteria bacterium]